MRGIFGDPKARILRLLRRGKKRPVESCGQRQRTFYDRKTRRVRDLSCGDTRVYLEVEIRRVHCRSCGAVKQEKLPWLANNLFYTKRFAFYVGRRCRSATVRDVARELRLDWKTVKSLEMEYMREQLRRAGTPGPKVIGIDETLHRQGAQLPHHRERSGPRPADLVRRHGSVREEHGPLLRVAGAAEMQGNPPGGDGHVEAVPQLHTQGRERPPSPASSTTSSTSSST